MRRAALVAATAVAAREGGAQPRAQARVDVLVADRAAAHAGVGAEVDAGLYVRLGVIAAAGVTGGEDDEGAAFGARGEAVVRFLLDPLRQSRRGAYLGGGAGVRKDGRGDPRGYVLAVVGVEGAPRGGWAPSLEVGVGGGARLAVVLRRAPADRR